MRFNSVQEEERLKITDFRQCTTDEQLADLTTKALDPGKLHVAATQPCGIVFRFSRAIPIYMRRMIVHGKNLRECLVYGTRGSDEQIIP